MDWRLYSRRRTTVVNDDERGSTVVDAQNEEREDKKYGEMRAHNREQSTIHIQ
jgi:hypothetical protein